jgi:hypothetical protein
MISMRLRGAIFDHTPERKAALAAATLPVLIADRLALVPVRDLAAFSMRLDVILVAGVALIALWWLQRRRLARWR